MAFDVLTPTKSYLRMFSDLHCLESLNSSFNSQQFQHRYKIYKLDDGKQMKKRKEKKRKQELMIDRLLNEIL